MEQAQQRNGGLHPRMRNRAAAQQPCLLRHWQAVAAPEPQVARLNAQPALRLVCILITCQLPLQVELQPGEEGGSTASEAPHTTENSRAY